MNANDLVSKIKITQSISFSFGKNGWGLSDEFISIGNRIKELSKHYNVYLVDAKIDALDDIYNLVFEMHSHEGASTDSNFSLESLEDRITNLMEENKRLREEIKFLDSPKTCNCICQKS